MGPIYVNNTLGCSVLVQITLLLLNTMNVGDCQYSMSTVHLAPESQIYQSNDHIAVSLIFDEGAKGHPEINESILTQLVVQRWRGGLLHFTSHRPGDAALAASLAVGGASTLKRHGGFLVLCIFSRSVIPVKVPQ